jgi:hypothetical protein
MPCTQRGEESLEQLVHEIRKIRVQRFFSLSDNEFEKLASQHEAVLPFLYEIYYRYGENMDDRMKTAVVIYLSSKGADFETVFKSLKGDASNREEVMKSLMNAERQMVGAYN